MEVAGSHAINLLVENCLEKLLRKYIIFHQTGEAEEYKDYERLRSKKETEVHFIRIIT